MAASAATVSSIAPPAVPLPASPAGDNFTQAQWDILMSIMDAIIPRIVRQSKAGRLRGKERLNTHIIPEDEYQVAVAHMKENVVNPPDEDTLDAFLAERPSDNAEFQDLLLRQLVHYAREDQRSGLKFILSALSTRAGSLLLTGHATPLNQLNIKTRAQIINSWRTHYLTPIQVVYKSFTSLGKNIFLKTSPLFPALTGYNRIPHNYTVGQSHDYTFLQFPESPSPVVLDFDVVIVGSGIGGGVSAKILAEAGFSVLVVDKSYYYPPSQLPMTEAEAHIHLFENGGVDTSVDSSLTIMSGSNFGGGGTVNWSASLQTQGFVRREWARERKLPLFESDEFQEALDRVCERMGVNEKHIRHNHGNQILLEGARKLGYAAKAVPQNTGNTEHYCGHCTLGCSSCEKQGPTVCWLPDAARAGAQFIEGLEVANVLFEEKKGKKTAVGIKGLWTSRNKNGGVDGPVELKVRTEVLVKAKRVIMSAGSLWSPVLLAKSGLKNKQIGRNLYMHPVNFVSAVFPEDVRPWEGAALTTVCTSFENLDGHGHGVKLEAVCMLPSLALAILNWQDGVDYKFLLTKYRHLNSYILIVRDRDPGRVYPDPATGKPRIEYTPSAFDRRHAMVGLLEMAKMLLVTGATEIHPNLPGAIPYIVAADEPRSINHPRFVAWLSSVEAVGNVPPMSVFACAHQMGSNRMSATPGAGVVDPNGRVWESEGLYVVDASVFPSASGVNPMVTNLAISDITSRKIAAGLRAETASAKL